MFAIRETRMYIKTLDTIRPSDVAVLLFGVQYPGASYPQIAQVLGISMSTAHSAHRRLLARGLMHEARSDGRLMLVAIEPTLEFLQFGLRYVFHAPTISRARGVPTGFSSPALAPVANVGVQEEHALVWPSQLGQTTGVGIVPLIPDAPSVAFRDAGMYAWLAAVDALRVGDARIREMARHRVAQMLRTSPSAHR